MAPVDQPMEGTVRRLIPLGFALLLGACAPTWGETPAPAPQAVAYVPPPAPPPAPYVEPSYGRPYLPPDVVVRHRYSRHRHHHYHHHYYVRARAPVTRHHRPRTNSGGLPRATAQ